MHIVFQCLSIVFLVSSFVFFSNGVFADDDICEETMSDDECEEAKEKAKAKEKEEAQEDLEDTQEELEKEEERLKAHQEALDAIQTNLNATLYQIRQVEDTIETTEATIERKADEIKSLEKRLSLQKKVLQGLVQSFYVQSQDPLSKILLEEGGLSALAHTRDHTVTFQGRINGIVDDVKETREKIIGEKDNLEELKKEKEALLVVKKQQEQQLQEKQNYQATKVAKSESKVRSLNSRLSSIRSILSGFLGDSYSLDDVVDAVKNASKETGVRKEFLFAMLDKETDLGRFTGGCTYENTRIKDADKKEFKKITKALGYDYKKVKVSCSLSYGYGGAMGVAQFMPTTWIGYKDEISKKTGNSPADPWDLEDGIMGMAIKLDRAGADSKSKEHYAAKLYYCGGPSSAYWNTHCEAYADTVTSWANGGYDEFF
jgi:membrane-bound lytic murein transglycosylase B